MPTPEPLTPQQHALAYYLRAARVREAADLLARLAQRKDCGVFAKLALEKRAEADALSALGTQWLVVAMEAASDE